MSPSRALLAAFVLVAACASDPAPVDGPPVPDPSTTAPVADSLDLPPVDQAALASFFEAEGVASALAYDQAFRSTASGDDLKAVYDQALALTGVLFGPIQETYLGEYGPGWDDQDRFVSADLNLPGLAPTCVAECTEPAFDLRVADWQQAARRTGDDGAEAFFDALAAVYGPDPGPQVADGELMGWPVYLTQTWDYGGYSNLGSGVHAELLDRFVAASGTDGAFADEIGALREDVASDLLGATCIGSSAQDALAEVIRVNEAMTAPDIAQTSYDARVGALEDPAGAGIETGCASPDAQCSCIGG